MVIAQEMKMPDVLAKLIEKGRSGGASAEHMEFLSKVKDACKDSVFAECLEVALDFSTGYAPFLERVEKELVRGDGAIRPLLEDEGIRLPTVRS